MDKSDRECGEPPCKVARLEEDETLKCAGDIDSDDSDEYLYGSELQEEEIDNLLEVGQDLQEEEKGKAPQHRSNQYEILPEGWIHVTHISGMPFYVHRPSGVCSMSKPYFIGEGSLRKHDIPVSAVPCLQYLQALHGKVSAGEDKIAGTETTTSTQAIELLGGSSATPPCGLMMDSSKIESAFEKLQNEILNADELRKYCEKRFLFKSAKKSVYFKTWEERRIWAKEHGIKQKKGERKRMMKRSQLPESESLILIERQDDPGKLKTEYIIHLKDKNYASILIELVQIVYKVQPKVVSKAIENTLTPCAATVIINDKHYGMGYGKKKVARLNAVKATLEMLVPEVFGKNREQTNRVYDDLSTRFIVKCDNLQPIETLIKVTNVDEDSESSNRQKVCEMNPEGMNYGKVLGVIVYAFKSNMKYECKQIVNVNSATVIIDEKHYETGYGYTQKKAKSEASKATLKILLPKFFRKRKGTIIRVVVDDVFKNCVVKCDNLQPLQTLIREVSDTTWKRVFVGSRSFSNITEEDLKETFSVFGKVVTCIIPKKKDGSNCNFGCVEFENGDAVDKAVKQTEKLDIKGNNLKINKKPDSDKRAPRRSIKKDTSANERSRNPSFSRLRTWIGDHHDSYNHSSSHHSGSPHHSSRDDRSQSGRHQDSYKHNSSHHSRSPHYSSRDDRFHYGDRHDGYKHSSSHHSGSLRYSNRDDGYNKDRYSSQQRHSRSPSYARDRKSSRYDGERSHSPSPMSPHRRHHGTRENPLPNKCLENFGPSLYTAEKQIDNQDGVSKLDEPIKQVPVNASAMHPGKILHSMKPSVQYKINQITKDNKPHFTVSSEIDGATFIGEGPSVKKAKFDLAREAVRFLYGVISTFEIS